MYTAKINRDPAGVPTGLGSIAKSSLLGGAIAGLTQLVDPDAVVIPDNLLEKVAVEGTKVGLAAVGQKYISTGEVGIPFKA